LGEKNKNLGKEARWKKKKEKNEKGSWIENKVI